MKIGVYLKRLDWKVPNVASDRIRGEWVMKFCPEMEEWKPGQAYDAVIFHSPVREIAETPGLKILDICDPVWTGNLTSFRDRVKTVDGIVTATEELKRQVLQVVTKPVRVIGDGHWFKFYESRAENPHARPARIVVWFGYAANAASLRPLLPALKAHDLRLKVIAEENPFPKAVGVEFVRWQLDGFIREISQADFAVLPPAQPYKSNNKDISALLSGVPVAKTPEDVARLVDPAERRKDMAKAPGIIALHDARFRAQEYVEWIQDLSGRPIQASGTSIVQYTAICGGFDPARADILSFGDTPRNKFTEPVMNAKPYKLLPHQFVEGAVRIWMDGNIHPIKDASTLVRELLGDHDIAVFKHPWRRCLYEEHEAAKMRLAPQHQPLIDEQVARYRSDGMPPNFGLAECGVILSRSNNATREFFNWWWSEVTRWCSRDQMSFPYVWWRMRDRIRVRLVEAKTRFGEWFKYVERK